MKLITALVRFVTRCPTCHALLCVVYASGKRDARWQEHGSVL